MTDGTILRRPDEGIAELILDRPDRRNALSIELRDEIAAHLERLAEDSALKVLVISGNGPVFSSGFDLDEFSRASTDAEFADRLWASSDRYHRAVASFPLVTVAAVGGPAIAGGFDLAVLCDLRVAASTAYFEHPEHAFGEVVYGPLWDLVGGAVARDLALTGRRLSADDALRLGLVSEVVPADELQGAALALARRVAVAPRDVLRRMKRKALDRSQVVLDEGKQSGGTLRL